MGMYDDIVKKVSENIKINGYPFYAENIEGQEPFNRREYNFEPVLNGTLTAKRGKYIQRKFSFKTTVYHKKGRHDAHNKILKEIISKPVIVVSRAMGGKFKAVVNFSESIPEASPYHTEYDVDIVEVPDKNSKIVGENRLVVPPIKKISLKDKSSSKDSSKNKTNNNVTVTLGKCKVPFRKGQKNNCVKVLQEKLISLGYLSKRYKSGVYDNTTIEAVKSFQRSTKGQLLVDGVFGKYTRKYLLKK